jgi:hypothetical protein
MKQKTMAIGITALLIGFLLIPYVNAQISQKNDDTTPPSVWISRPQRALYIKDREILPFFIPIIIGAIQIWPNAVDDESGINRLELYIDNELKATFYTCPKSWSWNEITPQEFRHAIQLIGYDNAGNMASDEITVWKFR